MKPGADSRYINRELSWLAFNRRVLDEAGDQALPLLERLRFLAITGSNLDEFCMVRVGGLKQMIQAGARQLGLSELTPRQQMQAVTREMRRLMADQSALYHDLAAKLADAGLTIAPNIKTLTPEQRAWTLASFSKQIFPVLSPVAARPGGDYQLAGLRLHLAVRLAPAEPGGEERHAIVPLGPNLPRFLSAPDPRGVLLTPIEHVAPLAFDRLFAGCRVLECAPFRITRNAEIELREDASPDLVVGMQDLLDERQQATCIRLEVSRGASRGLTAFLRAYLGVAPADQYLVDGPLALRDWMSVAETEGFERLRAAPWPSVPSPEIDAKVSLFPQIAERDLLLIHPFDAFDPVVKFIEDAATDPDVLAIKQVLYRTAPNSRIIAALIRAAQAGRHVTVLIELKARFDEACNIEQARRLEQAGAQVVYGVRGLKTHAKLCLVVRREADGVVRYVHFGTGNYNERTATLYSDVGLFTCHPELGADASDVFNAITGYSQPQPLRRLEMAPFTLRAALTRWIANETARARNGEPAMIMLKMNALVDPDLIEALYAASRAGVRIHLNIRGICCLRPGARGLSETISVVSLIDCFLEHARIFYFLDGGRERLFISSADGMPRNLDRRVELMVPVLRDGPKRRLLRTLRLYFKDNVKAHVLNPDGRYRRAAQPAKRAAACRAQQALREEALERAQRAERSRPTALQPHLAREKPSKPRKTSFDT